MTATLEETLGGADMEGGEVFCDDLYNNLKNHWRANYGGEPCGSAGLEYPQPGMIISDSYDDRLYHIILASGCACSEIVQTCVPVPDDVPVYFGYEFDGAIYYDELTLNEFMIEAKNHADVEGVTINLLETNQRFRVRQNSDVLSIYLSTTDAYLTWSDGALNLQTEEADTSSEIHIHGNGTGYGVLDLYDEDDAESLVLTCVGGQGRIYIEGVTPGYLRVQHATSQPITFWDSIVAGNPDFRIFGWNTASGAVRRSTFRMDDANDEFLIEAENHADHEGITVSLLETNQRFRVRQNADIISMYLDGTNAFLTWSDGMLNLQNDEANTVAEVHIHGNGTGFGRLNIYDEDNLEWLSFYCSAQYAYISAIGTAPVGIAFQYSNPQGVNWWKGIVAGNPNFDIYGYITAGAAVRYGRFRMDDTWDEFLIEAENNANLEGVSISLLETNQRFRVRQNSDIMSMYLDGTDAYLTWSDGALNLQTDEADTSTSVHIHGNGTGRGNLQVYDEDDNEYLELLIASGVGQLRTQGVAPGKLSLQANVVQNITFWDSIVAGNPDFYIYGYITEGASRRYSRFRLDDTFNEFYIEAEADANHEGITVSLLEAAQEFRLRGVGGAERFHIDQTGILGYMRQGELFQWTYQGDLADEASFTLPAFTDACWGFIQAGDNEEYALFSVDNVGNVTLITNSANVVANANTDGKLVLGIASPEEPLTIRNRLGATENINLIIWYS